jgi:hypothetical protein
MVLLSRGLVTEEQLRNALREQQLTKERIGEFLERLGVVSRAQVTSALAAQWQCPAVFHLTELPPEAAAVPLNILRECRMVPILSARNTRMLHVAFDGPVDHSAAYAIGRMLDCRAEPCIATSESLDEMLRQAAEQARATEVNFDQAPAAMIARTARNYAEELSAGEMRYVSCGGFFWMCMQRPRGPVHLVFCGKGERNCE